MGDVRDSVFAVGVLARLSFSECKMRELKNDQGHSIILDSFFPHIVHVYVHLSFKLGNTMYFNIK